MNQNKREEICKKCSHSEYYNPKGIKTLSCNIDPIGVCNPDICNTFEPKQEEEQKCPECKGDKYTLCAVDRGLGVIEQKVKCKTCKGTGLKPKPSQPEEVSKEQMILCGLCGEGYDCPCLEDGNKCTMWQVALKSLTALIRDNTLDSIELPQNVKVRSKRDYSGGSFDKERENFYYDNGYNNALKDVRLAIKKSKPLK